MLIYTPTINSWSGDEFIGTFRDLDEVAVYLMSGGGINGKICGIGNDTITIDTDWPEGKYKQFAFVEIDHIEEIY